MIYLEPSFARGNPLEDLIVVRGAGDLATGVLVRLFRCGFKVLALETREPLAVRRTVAFSEAMYEGQAAVEGIGCRRVKSLDEALMALKAGEIGLLEDPEARILSLGQPLVLVDAIMAKANLGTRIDMARLVLALGPGFQAGLDVHGVIETKRGHDLGRVIWSGQAEANTGIPGVIDGRGQERVLKAPIPGRLETQCEIGDIVEEGAVLAVVQGQEGPAQVRAPFTGLVRGLLRDGLEVSQGLKIGDIDPRCELDHAFTISDKSLAIGGGVLEAVFAGLRAQGLEARLG